MKIGKTKKAKKYFRDEYPDYKGGYTPKGNFPGLIPLIGKFINENPAIVCSIFIIVAFVYFK